MRLTWPCWLRSHYGGRGSRRCGHGDRDRNSTSGERVIHGDVDRADCDRSHSHRWHVARVASRPIVVVVRMGVENPQTAPDQVQDAEGDADQHRPQQDLGEQVVHVDLLLGGSGRRSRNRRRAGGEPNIRQLEKLSSVDAVAHDVGVGFPELGDHLGDVILCDSGQSIAGSDGLVYVATPFIEVDGLGVDDRHDQYDQGDQEQPETLHVL